MLEYVLAAASTESSYLYLSVWGVGIACACSVTKTSPLSALGCVVVVLLSVNAYVWSATTAKQSRLVKFHYCFDRRRCLL